MEPEITGYYCPCEEFPGALNIEENSQVKTNNAEVMTVLPFVAAFSGGYIRKRSNFLMDDRECKQWGTQKPLFPYRKKGFFYFRNTCY